MEGARWAQRHPGPLQSVGRPRLASAGPSAYMPRNPHGNRKRAEMANPIQFIQQTRSEIGKIVWPTRREVILTTVTV